MNSNHPRQRLIPFDEAYTRARETRAERCQRLLSKAPKQLTTAARLFDEAAYREATAIARGRPRISGSFLTIGKIGPQRKAQRCGKLDLQRIKCLFPVSPKKRSV